jgi:hypothetical protein
MGTCKKCGCTDNDCSQCIERTGQPCYWIDENQDLCSACAEHKTTFRPILFSTPMVQAILENRKRLTRRTKGLEKFNAAPDSWRYDGFCEEDKTHYMELISSDGKFTEKYFEVVCPYEVGDVFWVRETFTIIKSVETAQRFYLFKTVEADFMIKCDEKIKWKPSIFMPKEACRIFLKLKSFRVERLKEISEEDAINEGANPCLDELSIEDRNNNYNNPSNSRFPLVHVVGFKKIWSKINGLSSWNHNPFVFVYEFEQIEKPKDFIL